MSLVAIAWDIDGTLVDSEPLHHRALLAVCKNSHGVDLSDLPDQAFRGVQMSNVWLELRDRLPTSACEDDWLSAINSYYSDRRSELVAMPGAVQTIRTLKELGAQQVCVSNSGRLIVDANIDALGIRDCISFSICRDDVPVGKPDPYPYLKACRRLAVAPAQTLAVEDSQTGIRSARAAGLLVAGYSAVPWENGEVDFNAYHLSEIIEVFQRGQ